MKIYMEILYIPVVLFLSCGVNKNKVASPDIETKQPISCILVKSDKGVRINSDSFANFKSTLNDFYASTNEIDIITFRVISGKPGKNVLTRIVKQDGRFEIIVNGASEISRSILSQSDRLKLDSFIYNLNNGHYMQTCQEYSSVSIMNVISVKSKGEELYSISYNSDSLTKSLKEDEKVKMQNEIALLDFVNGLRRDVLSPN